MIRRQLIRWGVCLGTSWALKRGVDWYRGRDGNMALRLAEAGEQAGDVEQSYPFGDGPVPVGFPSSVPLLPNRQVVATRAMPREKKTYWKLDYWAHARAREAVAYHERGFAQAGWTVEPARREGKEGNGKGGWLVWARKDGMEAEVYVWDRGSSEQQAVQVTVEEPRGR